MFRLSFELTLTPAYNSSLALLTAEEKYFITFQQFLLIVIPCMHWYPSHNGKTPLLCAAEAGHDEVVAYLLQFTKVQTDLKEQPEVVESASVSHS